MTKRDFDVKVVDEKGKKIHFKAREGEVEDKPLGPRLGMVSEDKTNEMLYFLQERANKNNLDIMIDGPKGIAKSTVAVWFYLRLREAMRTVGNVKETIKVKSFTVKQTRGSPK